DYALHPLDSPGDVSVLRRPNALSIRNAEPSCGRSLSSAAGGAPTRRAGCSPPCWAGIGGGKGGERVLGFCGGPGTALPLETPPDLLACLAKLGPRPAPPFESVPPRGSNPGWWSRASSAAGQSDKLLRQASFKGARETSRAGRSCRCALD